MLAKFMKLRKKLAGRMKSKKREQFAREASLSKEEKTAKTQNEERMGIDASIS